MKIISWNVNGIRAVEKKGFVDWLLKTGADVVCIQETKASPAQLSDDLLFPGKNQEAASSAEDAPLFASVTGAAEKKAECTASYSSYFSSAKKPGYSGTAIYSLTKPDRTETLGVEEFDDEGRTTIAFYGSLAVISAYFPNSQDKGARLDYKLRFCDAIKKRCDSLVQEGYGIVLCGDYNIAHTAIDLANPKANEGNAGYLPEEREWMTFFTGHGYTDTFRMFCKDAGQYTWWSYRQRARERDIGWRIDYMCVNDALRDRVTGSVILKDVTGSDHCPVMIELSGI